MLVMIGETFKVRQLRVPAANAAGGCVKASVTKIFRYARKGTPEGVGR